jgi:uncharacterized membrane protein YbhN (UPF0104 family)
LIPVLFLLACGLYIHHHLDEFKFVYLLSPQYSVAASIMMLAIFILNQFQLSLFLKKFNVTVPFCELFAINMVMMLGNLLIPMRGGSGLLAFYLKKLYRLDYTAFAAIFAGTSVLVALTNLIISILALSYMGLAYGKWVAELIVVVVILLMLLSYLVWVATPDSWKTFASVSWLFRISKAWKQLTSDRHLLWRAGLLALLMSMAVAGAFQFIYVSLGVRLSFANSLTISSLGTISSLIPLTPGSLGIFDAVVVGVPHIFGLSLAKCISAAIAFRVICFLLSLILGLPGAVYLGRIMRRQNGGIS